MTLLLLAALTLLPQQPALAAPDAELAPALATLERGTLGEAERLFRDLAGSYPSDPRAYTGLARALVGQGKGRDALAILIPVGAQMQQSGDAESARPLLELATELAPRVPAARYFLGATLVDLGRHAAAATQFRTALELGDTQLATRVSLAAALWEAGDLGEAERRYRDALQRSRDPVVLHQFATFLLFVGEPDEAVTLLEEAIARGQPSPYLHLDHSRALARTDRAEEALAAARRATEIAPGLAQAHYQLGTLLARSGAHEAARAQLETVRRLKAEELDRQREIFLRQATLDEAQYLLLRGDPAGALDVLTDMPAGVSVLELRAAAWAALAEHDRAVAVLEQLLELEPDRRDVQSWLVRERSAE